MEEGTAERDLRISLELLRNDVDDEVGEAPPLFLNFFSSSGTPSNGSAVGSDPLSELVSRLALLLLLFVFAALERSTPDECSSSMARAAMVIVSVVVAAAAYPLTWFLSRSVGSFGSSPPSFSFLFSFSLLYSVSFAGVFGDAAARFVSVRHILPVARAGKEQHRPCPCGGTLVDRHTNPSATERNL